MPPGANLTTHVDDHLEEEEEDPEVGVVKVEEEGDSAEEKRRQQEETNSLPSAAAASARANAEIVARCQRSGQLYEDADFPASAESLSFDAREQFRWLRPPEIDSQAEFIKEGFSREDVSQGELGNCWILASLAGLAERPNLIGSVVLAGQSMSGNAYCGAFRFRLRQFGRAVDVLVDDRLPTRKGRPVYAQPLNGEFWVCLLEKALAKLHGCYEALEGGLIFEALTDMTGGVCEHIELPDSVDDTVADLPRRLAWSFAKSSVVGASSISSGTGEDTEMGNGLVYSHAYTITGVTEVQTKSGANGRWRKAQLLRVRNPWGTTEWQGCWSDSYSGWSREQKRAVGLVARDDGEFWMELADFVRFFSSVELLHVAPTPEGQTDWLVADFRGAWRRGSTAGGQPCNADTHFNNPQFVVDLTDSVADNDDLATCLVSLEEPDQRRLRPERRQYAAKAVFVYRGDGGRAAARGERPVAHSCPFQPNRTHVHTFRLRPGRYVLMPCTYEPNEEAEFLLRIFTEA